MTAAIEVRGLSTDYGDVRVIDEVSFDVPEGSVTGFVGANGSGKTTTIRTMLGLTSAVSGTARFDGKTYAELPAPRRVVGAVLDRIGAHPGHSARRHLELIAGNEGLPAARVDRVLDEVGLTDVADKALKRYSLGMTQRCALAAALLGEPRILLLDEPATGLDPHGIRWLREKMRAWADEGRAVLVSTHHLAELSAVVDRVVVLDRGRVQFEGPATDLTANGQALESAVFDLLGDQVGATAVQP